MHKGLILSLAGLAVCGLAPALAQTPSSPAPADPPAPAQTSPAPQAPVAPVAPAVPAPAAGAPSSLPSLPAYEAKPMKPEQVAPATQEGPPVVLPQVPASPAAFSAYVPYGIPDEDLPKDHDGSAYIPLDSWVYPAISRLYEMGYVDTMFLGMRPYTRRSVMNMLRDSGDTITQSDNEQAQDILMKLLHELRAEKPDNLTNRGLVFGVHQVYDRVMYINGQTLRDSYHLGQTIANDYGRPYQPGFNNLTGAAYLAELGRFSFYVRGEYQHAPAAAGYSNALADALSIFDQVPLTPANAYNATVPRGPIGAANPFRIVEGTLSYHLLGHEFSIGKQDAWIGPGQGAAFAWTNNAENIYSFRINRVEPMHVPLLSRVLGPLRYDFFYGSLKGHSDPNHPYVHAEMFAFRPTVNFEFGFERTVIFGGAGHEPVTLHTFLRSMFNVSDTTGDVKHSALDPGARFTTFNASYRLPFVRKYATFYVDTMSHDDVTPISAPRRADIRAGLDISQIPYLRKMELRAEGAFTDPRVTRSFAGEFAYFETIQLQGYTNKGYIMGDSLGREAKGGQAWLTYHLSPREYFEVEYLNKKTAKDFIADGTTQNQFKFSAVKRFKEDYELNAWVQTEGWKAPEYLPGLQRNTTFTVQFSYFPKLHTNDR